MSSVIELGSCGLHIVHDAPQTGMTTESLDGMDGNLHKVLHAMWKIFDESPARRDVSIRETCDVFLLHFCKTRWVEHRPVAS